MEEVEDKTIVQECVKYVSEMAQNIVPQGNILCFCVDQIECQDILVTITNALQ